MTTATALAWLNDVMQWLGRWIPRLVMCQPTHRAVLFGPRGGAVARGPGLVIYWPITHELVLIPVTTQSVELCSRVMPLDDASSDRWLPRVAMCGVAAQFRVTDPVKAATRALHLHALVDNRAQAAIGRAWKGDITERGFIIPARDELSGVLKEYGLLLEALDVTTLGVGVALKNLGDWSYAEQTSGTRPQ